MMPARWAPGGAPARSVIARTATGTLLVALSGALTGCATVVVPAAPVTAPQAVVQAGDRPEPCRFLSQAVVADLAGEQRAQIVGSGNTCSFTIGGQFTYQINVQPDDTGRFESERDRLFKDSVPVAGIGDEAFFRDGTAITVLGGRKGDSYFAVTLVPAVADPAGAGGAAPPAIGGQDGQNQNGQNQNQNGQAQNQADQALADAADADGDGVVDADLDADAQIDDTADADAVAAADADGDGAVDDDVTAAVQAAANAAGANGAGANGAGGNGAGGNGAGGNGAGGNGAGGNGAGGNGAAGNGADDAAGAAGGARGVVDDIIDAKARMTDVARAVADSI